MHLGRQLPEVLFVRLGHNDRLDPRPVCRHHLLLDAAYWKHQAAQRHFAGHGHIVPHLYRK